MKTVERIEATDGKLFNTRSECFIYERLHVKPEDLILNEYFESSEGWMDTFYIYKNTNNNYMVAWFSENPYYTENPDIEGDHDGSVYKGTLNDFVENYDSGLLCPFSKILSACNLFYKKNKENT